MEALPDLLEALPDLLEALPDLLEALHDFVEARPSIGKAFRIPVRSAGEASKAIQSRGRNTRALLASLGLCCLLLSSPSCCRYFFFSGNSSHGVAANAFHCSSIFAGSGIPL